jgi:hypothetical protein
MPHYHMHAAVSEQACSRRQQVSSIILNIIQFNLLLVRLLTIYDITAYLIVAIDLL